MITSLTLNEDSFGAPLPSSLLFHQTTIGRKVHQQILMRRYKIEFVILVLILLTKDQEFQFCRQKMVEYCFFNWIGCKCVGASTG